MMRILISGVNGFVGKVLFKALSSEHEILGTYKSIKPTFENCFQVDLSNSNQVQAVFFEQDLGSIDAIIHLAAIVAEPGKLDNLDILVINTAIAKNIALIAKHYQVKKVINLSSSAVYPNIDGIYDETALPNPAVNTDCIYGLSKLNSEIMINYFLAQSPIEILHLRTAIIYGDGMNDTRLIPVIAKEIKETNTVTLYGNGERLLNLIKVDQLIVYISFFVKNKFTGIFNVSEECISSLDLAKRMINEIGNSETRILIKEQGNKSKFVLNTEKLKQAGQNQ